MSISLVYDGTTVSLDGERVPDNPIDINPVTASGVRRTFLGTAKAWSRYRKFSVGFTWTGIPASVLGSLDGLSDTVETVYGTGFDANVFTTQYVNFLVDKQSWTVQESGLNSYTVTLKFEERLMADWYVSPTGDDTTGDGSLGTPYQHIHKAIDEASSGDIIICKAGIYDEEEYRHIVINIKIMSETEDYRDVIIKPKTLGYSSSWRYTWLSATFTNTIELYACTFVLDQSNVVSGWQEVLKRNCIVHDDDHSVSSYIVTYCHFYQENISSGQVSYLNVRNAGNIKAYKCVFEGQGNDIAYEWSNAMRIDGSAVASVKDCIIYNFYNGIDNYSSLLTANYNCYYNNNTNIKNGTMGANSITSDPAFTTGVEIDNTSPCYDAGVVVVGYVETYKGTAPDMGCYEIQPQILLYTGSYNSGSNSGTVNLSERVLTIGNISEVLMGGVNRPWCQQTTVTLDDSDNYFLGTLARGTEWYDGTFNMWAEHGTAWEQILTGFVPTAAWSYDYGQKIATINVTSMLLRASTVNMGYGGSVYTPLGYSSEFRSPVFFHNGTITDIGTDGTVTVEYYGSTSTPWTWQLGAKCWTEGDDLGTVNQDAIAPATINSVGSWEGTVVTPSTKNYISRITFLEGTKDWMEVGDSIVATVPWPSVVGYSAQTLKVIDLLDTAIGSMGLTWDTTSKTKFESDLLIVPATLTMYNGTEPFYGAAISNGLVPRYFGGDPWVTVVNDIMESVGANWTVSGIGEVHARIKRASALEAVTGTVDFNDAIRYLNEAWTFNESDGLSAARVYHEWDDIEQKFMGTAVTDGSFDSGAVLEMNAKWQRDLGGKILANRSVTWEKPISRLFPLPFPKEDWSSLVPGTLINLINIPVAFQPDYGSGVVPLIAQGKYTITARHYNYSNETVTVDLRQNPPLTGVFILGYSHLGGPDKLY